MTLLSFAIGTPRGGKPSAFYRKPKPNSLHRLVPGVKEDTELM